MILDILKFSGILYFRNLHQFLLLTLILAILTNVLYFIFVRSFIPSTVIEFKAHYERIALIYYCFQILTSTSLVFLSIIWIDKFASGEDEIVRYNLKERLGQFLNTAILFSVLPLLLLVTTIAIHHSLGQNLSTIPSTMAVAVYLLSSVNIASAYALATLLGLLSLFIFCRLSMTPYHIILNNQSLIKALQSSLIKTKPRLYRLMGIYLILGLLMLLVSSFIVVPIMAEISLWVMTTFIDLDQMAADMNSGMLQPLEVPWIVNFLTSVLAQFIFWLLAAIPMIVVSYVAFLHLTESEDDSATIEAVDD